MCIRSVILMIVKANVEKNMMKLLAQGLNVLDRDWQL